MFIEVAGPQWWQLRSVPFVHPVPLSMDGKPYALLPRDVELIRGLGDSPVDSPKAPQVLKAGDKAKVIKGAFAGFTVTLDKVARRKVTALATLFGRLAVVDLPLSVLEAV